MVDWINYNFSNKEGIVELIKEAEAFSQSARGKVWKGWKEDDPANKAYVPQAHGEIKALNKAFSKANLIDGELVKNYEDDGLLPRLSLAISLSDLFRSQKTREQLKEEGAEIVKMSRNIPMTYKGYNIPNVILKPYSEGMSADLPKLYQETAERLIRESDTFLQDAFSYCIFLKKAQSYLVEEIDRQEGSLPSERANKLKEDASLNDYYRQITDTLFHIDQMISNVTEERSQLAIKINSSFKPIAKKTKLDIQEDVGHSVVLRDSLENAARKEVANHAGAIASQISVLQENKMRIEDIRETLTGYIEAFRSGDASKAREVLESKAFFYNSLNLELGHEQANSLLKRNGKEETIEYFFGEEVPDDFNSSFSEEDALDKIAELDALTLAVLSVSEDLRDILTEKRSGMLIEKNEEGLLEITLIREGALSESGKVNKNGTYFDKNILSNTGAVTYVYDPISEVIKGLKYKVGADIASIDADFDNESWNAVSKAFVGKLEGSLNMSLHRAFGKEFWLPDELSAKASAIGGNSTIKKDLGNGLTIATNVSASLDVFSVTEKPSAIILPTTSKKLSSAIDVSLADNKTKKTADVLSLGVSKTAKKITDLFKEITVSFSLFKIGGKIKLDAKSLAESVKKNSSFSVGSFSLLGVVFREDADKNVSIVNKGIADANKMYSDLEVLASAYLATLRGDSSKIMELVENKDLPDKYANFSQRQLKRHIAYDLYKKTGEIKKTVKNEVKAAKDLGKVKNIAKGYVNAFGKAPKSEVVVNVDKNGSFLPDKTKDKINDILNGVVTSKDIPVLKACFSDLLFHSEEKSFREVFSPETYYSAFQNAQTSSLEVKASLTNLMAKMLKERVDILVDRLNDTNSSKLYKSVQQQKLNKITGMVDENTKGKIETALHIKKLGEIEPIVEGEQNFEHN